MLCKQRFLRAFSDLSLFIFPLLRYTRIAEYEGGSAYEITERIIPHRTGTIQLSHDGAAARRSGARRAPHADHYHVTLYGSLAREFDSYKIEKHRKAA